MTQDDSVAEQFGERVLILVPHPDDEVVGAAAAIEKQRERGGHVFAAYLTTGVPAGAGNWFGGEEATTHAVEKRWSEAKSVAQTLGIEIAGRQPVPARELKQHLRGTLTWLGDLCAQHAVDRIWAPTYEGGHQDHDVTNFLASKLASFAPVWEFAEYNFAGSRVHSQSFIGPDDGMGEIALTPAEQTRKRDLLTTYASEARNLGYVRVEREAFRRFRAHDYTAPPHPGRLFYQRFQYIPFHPRIDRCKPGQVCDAIAAMATTGPGPELQAKLDA